MRSIVGAITPSPILAGGHAIVLSPSSGLIALRPGANVAVLNSLAHVVVTESLVNEKFVREFLEQICSDAQRCCSPGEVAYYFGPFTTADDCSDRLMETISRTAGLTVQPPFSSITMTLPNLRVIDDAVAAERRHGQPGSGIQRHEAVADRDVQDPFIAAAVAALIVVTYVPQLSLWILRYIA